MSTETLGIQKTNDDAQVSKLSCVRLGYFRDDFVHLFVKSPQKRAPIINRGYFSRYAILRSLLLKFIAANVAAASRHQILVLGAGYDTTFLQLWKDRLIPYDLINYIELDFPEVTHAKTLAFQHSKELQNIFTPMHYTPTHDTPIPRVDDTIDENTRANINIHTHGNTTKINSFYHLLPADLRNLASVQTALAEANIDYSLPTFILSECVLVYMEPEESFSLLSWLSSHFHSASMMAIYEQINPDDAFGQQMMVNLTQRGCPLLGIVPSTQSYEERMKKAGWRRAEAKSMSVLYAQGIDPEEKRRIERLELFDEFEEWNLIQDHYCVVLGVQDDGTRLDTLKNLSLLP